MGYTLHRALPVHVKQSERFKHLVQTRKDASFIISLPADYNRFACIPHVATTVTVVRTPDVNPTYQENVN